MIIVKLSGGLANQMFQYATGLALSNRLRSNLYIDIAWFEYIRGMQTITPREYELDRFGIVPRKYSLLDKLSIKHRPPIAYKDNESGYQKDFESVSGNVFLDGHWQSYKYFESYREEILQAFSFQSKISHVNKRLLNQIKSKESISVHVRRGDYSTKAGRSHHGVMPPQYYEKALAALTKSLRFPEIFVFSDDIKWCRKNMKFKLPTTYIDSNSPTSGIEDMRLMAACKHNIIANSSFSWWAAWLNQNPKKLVYAPKRWFAQVPVHLDDLLPKDWIRI